MVVPKSLKYTISELTEVVRNNPFTLVPNQRQLLYQAFGHSLCPLDFDDWRRQEKEDRKPLSHGDRARGWLAIITARRVLPNWENGCRDLSERNWGKKRIDTAQSLVSSKLPPSKIFELEEENAYTLSGSNSAVNIAAEWALEAAHTVTLELFYNPHGLRFVDFFYLNNSGVTDDEEDRLLLNSDTIIAAVRAYSCIKDWPQATELKEQIFDVSKQREFWEWWLTEAIPQAWAMVEE